MKEDRKQEIKTQLRRGREELFGKETILNQYEKQPDGRYRVYPLNLRICIVKIPSEIWTNKDIKEQKDSSEEILFASEEQREMFMDMYDESLKELLDIEGRSIAVSIFGREDEIGNIQYTYTVQVDMNGNKTWRFEGKNGDDINGIFGVDFSLTNIRGKKNSKEDK